MNRIRPLALVLLALAATGCGTGGAPPPDDGPPAPEPPLGLAALSDEFDDPTSLDDWQRVHETEAWGFDQLELLDVDTTTPGAMTLMPYASTWFEDFRGALVFKDVVGDFVATTHLRVANRADDGPPLTTFSLGGLMVRAPRAVTPATWTPGGENYVFLSAGAADDPGSWQTEVKTTEDSESILEIEDGGPEVTLRAARIGPALILLLRWPGQSWQVHRRYPRPDLPQTLQVGFTTYTDWDACEPLGPVTHNQTLILGGAPDLVARYDYLRFVEPTLPVALLGLDLTNPAVVSDADLLAFLAFP